MAVFLWTLGCVMILTVASMASITLPFSAIRAIQSSTILFIFIVSFLTAALDASLLRFPFFCPFGKLPILRNHLPPRWPFPHPLPAIHHDAPHFHTCRKVDSFVSLPLETTAYFVYRPAPGISLFWNATHSARREMKRLRQGNRSPSPFAPLLSRAKHRVPSGKHLSSGPPA